MERKKFIALEQIGSQNAESLHVNTFLCLLFCLLWNRGKLQVASSFPNYMKNIDDLSLVLDQKKKKIHLHLRKVEPW